jgi:hypothetical protein
VSRQLLTKFAKTMAGTDKKLEHIRSFMRSADMISVTFKLEAIQAGRHEKVLTDITTEIDSLSLRIRERTKLSQELVKKRKSASK